MNNYLLDSHSLIWFLEGNKKLSTRAKEIIEDQKNDCCISIATLWGIAIKRNIGKLQLEGDFLEIHRFLLKNDIKVLPVLFEHLIILEKLDLHHRDPFDRLIIAQRIAEELTVVSKDKNFTLYKKLSVHW